MPAAGAPVLAADAARRYFFGVQSTAQSIPLGTANYTPVTITQDIVDTDNIHDPVTLNTRIVIGKALGWWEIRGQVAWSAVAPVANEVRRAGLMVNGAQPGLGMQAIAPAAGNNLISVPLPPILVEATAATDYVELAAMHGNAAALSTSVSGGYRSHCSAVWLGPS